MKKRDTRSAIRRTNSHVCRRCGACCSDLGGSFWTHSEHELTEAMAKYLPDDLYRDSGPCDMLIMHENGRATCLLQKWLGHNAKPAACREYPFDGEPCFSEAADDQNSE